MQIIEIPHFAWRLVRNDTEMNKSHRPHCQSSPSVYPHHHPPRTTRHNHGRIKWGGLPLRGPGAI